MDEFELITRCFRARTARRPGTVLGIGDDAALLDTGGLPLAHARATAPFTGGDDPDGIARRAFGIAFIRLAAQAVTPRWATLGLTLEASESDWVESFAAAAAAICEACGVELIGGDTTRGPGRAIVFALGTGSALPYESAPETGSALPHESAPGVGDALPRGFAPVRDTEFAVRLSLDASTNSPEHALADIVSTCAALAARGAEIRCGETPEAGEPGDAGRTLDIVARTDADGLRSLRAVAGRRRISTTSLDDSG